MNFVRYGMERDERIVKLVHQGKAFTRLQIEMLFFKQKDATRKCQLRLKRITEAGKVNKLIRSPHEPAIYYSGKRTKIMDHTLLVNDIYTAVMTQKPGNVRVTWYWEYPLMGGLRVADAMIDIYDIIAGKRHVVFVEVERYADHRFSKHRTYEEISQMSWIKEDWAIKDSTRILFPLILIVTEAKLTIKSQLDFKVVSISDIKRDVYSILLRRG